MRVNWKAIGVLVLIASPLVFFQNCGQQDFDFQESGDFAFDALLEPEVPELSTIYSEVREERSSEEESMPSDLGQLESHQEHLLVYGKDAKTENGKSQGEPLNSSDHVCVLDGPGKSRWLGVTIRDADLEASNLGKSGLHKFACMSQSACLEGVAKQFSVKGAMLMRGACSNSSRFQQLSDHLVLKLLEE